METPASIRKHPLHPMLIAFPIGLWIFSLICDGLGLLLADASFAIVAFYTLIGGLAGAIIAAVPGMVDLLSLMHTRVKGIALAHMSINIAVVILYAVNLGLRLPSISAPPLSAVALSLAGVVLLGISGWLGAEMVHVHGVGVSGVPLAEDASAKASAPQGSARRPLG
ncbi:DUF2231 domain-containing protein [Noviherbaspirillum massiliense]|uniref:DUF2231 domain-containing protein n=1 Tax=Noviherbaspirillum massiliense TaxID=1465823 RepID=UPI000310479E|nr:DUF2231 domain-containing protein [Noviherbaspirillum massiliense]